MSAATEMAKSRGEVLFGMPRAEYAAAKRLHHSTLKQMGRSPAHYSHALANPKVATTAMNVGSGAHGHILEPHRLEKDFAVWSGADRRTKEGKAEWAKIEADSAGKIILTEEQWADCIGMRNAVRSHKVAAKYLEDGDAEVSLFWDFEAPALGAMPGYCFPMKARLDWLSRAGAILDVKKTQDASEGGFQRQCVKLGYYEQAALYSDGYEAITGIRLPYLIVAAEEHAPYVTTVFALQPDALEYGRDRYLTHLSALDACRATKIWPGYSEGEVPLSLPYWLKKQMEQAQ